MKQSDQHATSPLTLTVHDVRAPELPAGRRTTIGRWKLIALLVVCAAPVIASYFTYYVIRPQSRTNYSALITPPRPIPADLPMTDIFGAPVAAASLRGQWLMVTVAASTCDERCAANLVLMRQLRETLGRDRDRVDKVWFVVDGVRPADKLLAATGATALLTEPQALAGWLAPQAGRELADHVYLVDPMGQWMMRAPVDPDPAGFKRDIERLLRASASWDRAGR